MESNNQENDTDTIKSILEESEIAKSICQDKVKLAERAVELVIIRVLIIVG